MPMDSTPVNWQALDALVIDFAKSERLIDDSSPPQSSSSYTCRLLVGQIRRSIESGDIDSAIDLLCAYAPAVLDDHRLLFRLHKQKFIELLRKGTADDRDSAIKCVRKSLAPRALDAYPEAYEEFKHALLAFIYDKDDQSSPVANEWSERRRSEIAGLLCSILRAHLPAYDPIFAMTLRYLISIHKGFCLHQGVSSPIANLTERLLLEERDPPATPQESLFEAPPFDEVDIQALAHAVELTRQGAINSLRFAKGDLYKAFQNEICRMKIDISVLDELVREYCIYRGIVDSNPMNSGMRVASGIENVDKWEAGSNLSENCSIVSDCDMSLSCAQMERSHSKTDSVSTQNSDIEVRYPCETNSISEDCCTSGVLHPGDNRVLERSRSLGCGERGKRKRWRGRGEHLEVTSEKLSANCYKDGLGATALVGCTKMDMEKPVMKKVSSRVDNNEVILSMKELASDGMAAEVFEEINGFDPEFFAQNPTLLFQLKQIEFFKLVHMGDHSGALKVASSHLGPLAAKYPSLLMPLKETLYALLHSSEEHCGKHLSLDAFATSLQVAIGRRFNIEEPQLMKVIRSTIHTHGEWFKLQMCKDQFEGLLWITSLKEHDGRLFGDAASKITNTSTQGSSPVTISSSNMRMPEDGSSSNQISANNTGYDENAILKVMEFLALPRGDAIHLLDQYNGNAETVIQQIFA